MQLGSRGASGLQAARHALPKPVRNFHIPAHQTRLGAGRKFLTQSRHFLARFVGHLTTPGIGNVASRAPSFPKPNFSSTIPSSRHFLSRPASFLPRAPGIPRSVTQVGLGSARQFSSARPIFQNLVQNVPVAARAFVEADINVKSRKTASSKVSKKARKTSKGKKVSYKQNISVASSKLEASAPVISDLDLYFKAPSAEVTTSLHIPLAPTPSERTPLAERGSRGDGSFLPIPSLASIHVGHEQHATRVASLFSRLDAANVWDKGVTCSAYSHLAHGQGVATILQVEFIGWTQAEVRAVIGESGTGWCAMEESNTPGIVPTNFNGEAQGDDSDLSETSSVLSGNMGDDSQWSSPMASTPSTPPLDPSASFVLPTLDFSSSFMSAVRSAPSTPPSELSDFEYLSDGSMSSFQDVPPTMGLSADFLRRVEREEPMEAMF